MNISAVYAPENSSMDFGLVDPESYLIRRDSVSRILAIARELHISLDSKYKYPDSSLTDSYFRYFGLYYPEKDLVGSPATSVIYEHCVNNYI